ncbi:hypothetical protein Cylst_1726 [Cylindrospermum stagnale PCC 7417]|jgi:hypothetical protein|uniref:Cyanobacterial aminoacyl-tRNA synthetase CAAD domain-containing protein n=1 Tax=Cylindrospermum stagnale PCC 7417 TaxID=56107 RepID=K9WWV6_9NOST|nr:CAAD domain-containing protein [Cylindrospermum stagnale]AFZ23997.1 hypothetical protein Cylst_1726 [Cylindrospermum stagnale PCC 7417]
METQQQQPESVNTISSQGLLALDGTNSANLPKLPPARESEAQWQQIGRQVSDFLAQLPEYIGSLFNKYKQALLSLAVILSALITVKVVLAVLDAINGIPLLSPTFELIGIGYVTWIIFRYLIKAETRRELAEKLGFFKKEIVGREG